MITLFLAAQLLTCQQPLLTRFEQLRDTAAQQYPQHATRLLAMRASFGVTPPNTDARVLLGPGAVTIGAQVCGYPEAQRYAIVAHEVGHAIHAAIAPNDYINEHIANYYGAKLLTQGERAMLMERYTERCASGSKDYCWLQDSWQYAFTH